jgi:trehalose 6-phosphate phosphatase
MIRMNLTQAAVPESPNSIALFLDFDGTLVELAERPEQVIVTNDLRQLLGDLFQQLHGALAIVSGRPLAAIDALLQPLQLPGAGLHGVELRDAAGAGISAAIALDLRPAADALRRYFGGDGAADSSAILVEDKVLAIAVHYRQQPHRADEAERALRAAVESFPVEIVAGKFVFEARPRGIDKGSALRRLMQMPAFAGRQPVFIGDDVTDEDGMAAAQALGGIGIKVGQGSSIARERLHDPAAVSKWLRGLAGRK